MDLAYIDYVSNNENTWLNKSSVLSKVIMAVLITVTMIMIGDWVKAAAILTVVLILTRFTGMSFKRVLYFLLYPFLFSLPFAVIKSSYSISGGLLIVLKSLGIAAGLLVVIASTPYTQLFSMMRLFLPDIVVDAMFFTYRTIFILADKIRSTLSMLRLRGGLRPTNLFFYLKSMAGTLGMLIINTFDMAERMYNIYTLRGYEGELQTGLVWNVPKTADVLPILFGLFVLLIGVIPWTSW